MNFIKLPFNLGVLLILSFSSCNDSKKVDRVSHASTWPQKTSSSNDSVQAFFNSIKIKDTTPTTPIYPTDTTKLSPVAATEDSLVEAFVTLATPMWGDGKNEDDSYVTLIVSVKSNDGNEYDGIAFLRDNLGIGPNSLIYPHLEFSQNKVKINYNNISDLKLLVVYVKQDYARSLREDQWDVRSEVVLKFKSGRILATGYNEPAMHLEFYEKEKWWYPFNHESYRHKFYVPRERFYPYQTLNPPVK